MGTVFQSITAEISKDFENVLVDKYAKSFLDRVCDLTGTIMLCNSNTPLDAPDSLKICGTWASVSQAHNILSAYTISKQLMRSESADFDESENSVYDTDMLIHAYSSTPNQKRKGYNDISDEFTTNSGVIRQPRKKKSKIKTDFLQKNDILPVPVLLSSVDSTIVKPVVYSSTEKLQQMEKKPETSNSDYPADYESNMYFVENEDSTRTDADCEVFHCAMCRYSTNSAKNLESHLDRYHFKPVTCQICGRGFGYERDLKRHLMKNKYSCGSRRSIINKNFVNSQRPEISTDDQSFSDSYEISINKPESTDLSNFSDHGHTCYKTQEEENSSLKNIQQEKPLDENLFVQIKQEPELIDDNENQDMQEASGYNISSDHSPVALGAQLFVHENLAMKKSTEVKENRSSYETSWEDLNKRSYLSDSHIIDTGSSYEDDFATTETRTKVNKMTFSCKHCSYTAVKKQHIIDHVCRMHKKQFQCDHCQSAFGLKKDLHRHLRRSHGVEIPYKKTRPTTILPLVAL